MRPQIFSPSADSKLSIFDSFMLSFLCGFKRLNLSHYICSAVLISARLSHCYFIWSANLLIFFLNSKFNRVDFFGAIFTQRAIFLNLDEKNRLIWTIVRFDLLSVKDSVKDIFGNCTSWLKQAESYDWTELHLFG